MKKVEFFAKFVSDNFPAVFLCVIMVILSGCQQRAPHKTSNLSPRESLQSFEVAPGFQIELIASEPLITDPVDMEIDPAGNLYVVEMPGNPFDKTGTGKVKLLKDTDGDGQMDKSIVFADSLILPAGVTSWKKGILVTNPPFLLYLEDTDGDGKADIREKVLTGFDSTDVESNVNNPVYGLDNWIYLGNGPGDGTGDIAFYGDSQGPRIPDNSRGHMVRLRPDTRELETTSGRTQFGHNFDNWGHHFLVNNSNHIYQEVIAAKYLSRNPGLLVSDATQSVSDHGEAAEVYPITANPENQLLTDVGVFTSACSILPYGGALFPAVFDSVVFVAEPVGNLVHADVIRNSGSSFIASRLYKQKEFLASTDAWCRPVNLYTGPDGALYVVDYYREIIEGPEWMSEEVLNSGHLYNGSDKGRIYRVSPVGSKPPSWSGTLSLANASSQLLAEKLADSNIWWRQNAQRILVQKNDPKIISTLVTMASDSHSALGRLHALWTLQGMHQLTSQVIAKALRDPEAGVRENAIRLAEIYEPPAPGLIEELVALQNDPSPKVRYQLLCTLGSFDGGKAAKVRENILFRDLADPWVQVAALSAASIRASEMLAGLEPRYHTADSSLAHRLGQMIAASDGADEIYKLLVHATANTSGKTTWRVPVLDGMAEGLHMRKTPLNSPDRIRKAVVMAYMENADSQLGRSCLHVLQETGLPNGPERQKALDRVAIMAGDRALSPEARASALELLALGNPQAYTSMLKGLLVPAEPLPVQRAALKALSVIPDETVSEYIIEKWAVLTPEIRDEALNTFLVYPFKVPRITLLLDAISKGKIEGTSLGWARTVTLMRDVPDKLKHRARELLAKGEGQQEEYIKKYQAALDRTADKNHGKEVFLKNCSVCHQIGGNNGKVFGPDLSTVRNWLPDNLVVNILDPAASIANGYDLWSVELEKGGIKQGIIASETASAITLRYPGGQEEMIARSDVRSLKSMNTSAMPPGFERVIDQQQMADLIAFLRRGQSLP